MDRKPQKFNPTKLNNDTVQFYCYITIVNKTYLIIGQQVLSRFLVPYALE